MILGVSLRYFNFLSVALDNGGAFIYPFPLYFYWVPTAVSTMYFALYSRVAYDCFLYF